MRLIGYRKLRTATLLTGFVNIMVISGSVNLLRANFLKHTGTPVGLPLGTPVRATAAELPATDYYQRILMRGEPERQKSDFSTGAFRKKTYGSIAALKKALLSAAPGDELLLADGQYELTDNIDITACGKPAAPIIVAAAHPGKVILTGTGAIRLQDPASYIEIRGFVFRHASSRATSGPGTSHCRWSGNVFETSGKGEDLTIAGDYQEVDHNNFLNKDAMGRFLAIRGRGRQIATHLWIHHNYFAHYKDQGGANGAEAFQFGLSGFSMSTSNSLVEYNLFEDCNGEAELISVKASGVTLRYNTFRDSKAQFTVRHGNHNLVYGNYFFRTPGIRFFGDDHLIYSNYFEDCPVAIQIGDGDGEVADGALLTCHDRPDRVFVGFNTLIDNKSGIVFNARRHGLGATAVQVTANLIQGGGAAVRIGHGDGSSAQISYSDNVCYDVEKTGDLPLSGQRAMGNRIENPELIRRTIKGQDVADKKDGVIAAPYHLSSRSPRLGLHHKIPAIFSQGKATFTVGGKGQFTDIDGQPGKAPLTIGADQRSPAPVINVPLQASLDGIGIRDLETGNQYPILLKQ